MKSLILVFSVVLSCVSNAGIRVSIGSDVVDGQYGFYFDKEPDTAAKRFQRVEAHSLRLENPKIKFFSYEVSNNGKKMLVAHIAVPNIDFLEFSKNKGKTIDYPNAIYIPFSGYYGNDLSESFYESKKGKIGYLHLFSSKWIYLKATGNDIEALQPWISMQGKTDNLTLTINNSNQKDVDRVSVVSVTK